MSFYDEPRVKLASFKFGIYNPHSVSLRRYSRDSVLGLLPDEHSRSSQLESLAHIPSNPFHQFDTPNKWVSGYEIIDSYRLDIEQDPSMEKLMYLDNPECEEKWGRFTRQLPFADKRFLNPPIFHEFSIFNYTVRRLKPEILSSWRDEIGRGQILRKLACDCSSNSNPIKQKLSHLRTKPAPEDARKQPKQKEEIPREGIKKSDEKPILLQPAPWPECTGEPMSKAELTPSCLATSPVPECPMQPLNRVPGKLSEDLCKTNSFRI